MMWNRALIVTLALPVALVAQQPAPMTLDSGVGEVHWTVTTASAEAQQFFDQGMAYLYGFNHDAAIRSFERAAQLDPKLAMADWGIALALGPNINLDVDPDREKQAFEAVQKAMTKDASPKERDLIAALARRYSNDPNADLKAVALTYSEAMGTVSKKYPDDLEIATLYAESMMDLRPWKFWSHDGKPAPQTEQIVSVLESVLKRNPNHLGANHYYIHAIEASPHPERAMESARRFETLAPASGHLVHMPAHIFQRTGNYAGAAKANERAAAVDRRFIARHGGESFYAMMYYNHNLQFGLFSYSMEGSFEEARRMADEFGANAATMAKQLPPIEAFVATPMLVLVRFGKWQDVVHSPEPSAGPFSTALSHFARGVAFARLGDVAAAERERDRFQEARKAFTDDPGLLQNSAKDLSRVAAGVLDGRIAEAKGDAAKAIESYRAAVEAEDALGYDEPPDWFYPVRETLGGALLRAGREAEAETIFREDLKRNPDNPRSLFGLAEARRRQKKSAAAETSLFRKRWQGRPLSVGDL